MKWTRREFVFVAACLSLLPRCVLAATPCIITGSPPISYDCIITTVAGVGTPTLGDGGPASQAVLNNPFDVVVGPDGLIYITDTNDHKIRRIGSDGRISTIAGTGTADNRDIGDGKLATMAQLRFPTQVVFGPDGLLYIADARNYRIRKILSDGTIKTVAGTGGIFSNPAAEGQVAIESGLSGPSSIAFDSKGDLFIAEFDRSRVWRVAKDGILHLVAGNGACDLNSSVSMCNGPTGDGGSAVNASISAAAIDIDKTRGLLYIGAVGYGPIRKVDLATGVITTVPGTRCQWLRVDSAGDLFFSTNAAWRRLDVSTRVITTIAGNGTSGFSGDGGPATQALVSSSTGVSVDESGNIYLADRDNNRIRKVGVGGIITTIAGGGRAVPPVASLTDAVIFDSQGLAVDRNGKLFFADFDHNYIRKIDGTTVTIVAGNGAPGARGDGGVPLLGFFGSGLALRFDQTGNLYFIDQTTANTVRMIAPGKDGTISGNADERIFTVAGQPIGVQGEFADHGAADGGPALKAVFFAIRGLALDSHGNLYIADWQDSRIRKVSPGKSGIVTGSADEIITTIAGTGVPATSGDGGSATQAAINRAGSVAVDSKGNVYINDNCFIRRIDAATPLLSKLAG